MDSTAIGQYIKQQRKKIGLTQKELAEKLGIEPQTVSKWERGMGTPDTSLLVPLSHVFGVSVEDILEPPTNEIDETVTDEQLSEIRNLPTTVYSPDQGTENKNNSSKVHFSDFFSTKKIKEKMHSLFGENCEWTVNRKLLFGGVFKGHKHEDFERAATQGMFKNELSHRNGICSPFLFFWVFIVLLACYGISIKINTTIGFCFASSIVVLSLLTFVYEVEFPRSISIFRCLLMVLFGGMSSVFLALVASIFTSFLPSVAITLLAGPIEEICKAFIVILLILIFKPRYALSGLLIGFSVGAGFTLFENIMYCSSEFQNQTIFSFYDYLYYTGDLTLAYEEAISEATSSSLFVGLFRSGTDLLIGHHYWTALFGGAVVLCKKEEPLSGQHFLNGNVLLVLGLQIILHTSFNAFSLIPTIWGTLAGFVVIGTLTFLLFNRMFNVGLSQYKLSEEYGKFSANIEPVEPDCESSSSDEDGETSEKVEVNEEQ